VVVERRTDGRGRAIRTNDHMTLQGRTQAHTLKHQLPAPGQNGVKALYLAAMVDDYNLNYVQGNQTHSPLWYSRTDARTVEGAASAPVKSVRFIGLYCGLISNCPPKPGSRAHHFIVPTMSAGSLMDSHSQTNTTLEPRREGSIETTCTAHSYIGIPNAKHIHK
jgi:hypothetical protein